MQTTQHSKTRCPVYLHPAACTNPTTVERIQQRTGLLVIINLNRALIAPRPAPATSEGIDPWGGDAA